MKWWVTVSLQRKVFDDWTGVVLSLKRFKEPFTSAAIEASCLTWCRVRKWGDHRHTESARTTNTRRLYSGSCCSCCSKSTRAEVREPISDSLHCVQWQDCSLKKNGSRSEAKPTVAGISTNNNSISRSVQWTKFNEMWSREWNQKRIEVVNKWKGCTLVVA